MMMGKLYVKMDPPADLNRNTEWFTYPGVWTTYILILFFSWLIVLSLTNCTPGMAWTIVNLSHFAVCSSPSPYYALLLPFSLRLYSVRFHLLCIYSYFHASCNLEVHAPVTYHFFHWKKGTPFGDDQGIYNGLTWWEQIDNGKQLTRNRKFLTVVPVVLYLIASHTTDYQHPMLFFNTLAVLVLVVAKFPNMHKVRIFGINGDQ
ncbi:hypothetical protein Sango_0226000 [Sesamum angolense]|uniref:ORM1-like protein 2 n=1 Tax=Sesamum angolense TaxID=2727404 RepID=A0AAE2C7I0_9LAMI|nr:hypothetical protein Sango_0226000 [Sesamum angolense]